MNVRKTLYSLLLFFCCFVLLAACGTGTTTPTPTATASGQTSCPTGGKGRPAVMTPLSPGSHANIVYVSEHGGTQTLPFQARLMRYDISTGSKTTLLSFDHPDTGITSAQISADGQWILFVASSPSENQARLQLIRADGQKLQTLFCQAPNGIGSIQWSPDRQHVAFAAPAGSGSPIDLLNLATGQLEQLIAGSYQPFAWLDNARLYVTQVQGDQKNLFLLDTSTGESAARKPGADSLCSHPRAVVGLKRASMACRCSPVPAPSPPSIAAGEMPLKDPVR